MLFLEDRTICANPKRAGVLGSNGDGRKDSNCITVSDLTS